jgi:hypothetical protein
VCCAFSFSRFAARWIPIPLLIESQAEFALFVVFGWLVCFFFFTIGRNEVMISSSSSSSSSSWYQSTSTSPGCITPGNSPFLGSEGAWVVFRFLAFS